MSLYRVGCKTKVNVDFEQVNFGRPAPSLPFIKSSTKTSLFFLLKQILSGRPFPLLIEKTYHAISIRCDTIEQARYNNGL